MKVIDDPFLIACKTVKPLKATLIKKVEFGEDKSGKLKKQKRLGECEHVEIKVATKG